MVNIPNQALRQAIKNGDKYYFTGIPCKNGHISNRITKNRSCVECCLAKTRVWRDNNKDHCRKYDAEYQKLHPEIKRVSEENRRARKLASGGTFSRQDIKNLFEAQNGLCAICNGNLDKYHIDHKIPLSRGGSNFLDNIQLLCPRDNVRKNNKTDEEYRSLISNG